MGDRDAESLIPVLDQYPLLYEQPLSSKEKITYQARDKINIPVMMIHGDQDALEAYRLIDYATAAAPLRPIFVK